MIEVLGHALLVTTITVHATPIVISSSPNLPSRLMPQGAQSQVSILNSPSTAAAIHQYLDDQRQAKSFRRIPGDTDNPAPNVGRSRKKWAPWIGAAVGAAVAGVSVADEEDLVLTGKAMWVGVGAAGGAVIGWLVGKMIP